MAGHSLDLTKDINILNINSPKKSVDGPYKVVYKNVDERWAIVALDWDGNPNLGMRWFWGNGGNPFSTGKPIWLIIPNALINSILDGLPLEFKFRKKIEKFLNGEIKGSDL
ncbi:hypothetical protein [Pontibacter arcticus]|uniref:Uncharacterized protein n=1 Tax=Pontibacter arcticus TaxID=2080288 RepID=A0A364RC80_9BACT|nr:hypothetical protein [Pontibacter arcticus]RAU81879.1 hypothetical protein DP923_14410 [Pontibacter arcticus]